MKAPQGAWVPHVSVFETWGFSVFRLTFTPDLIPHSFPPDPHKAAQILLNPSRATHYPDLREVVKGGSRAAPARRSSAALYSYGKTTIRLGWSSRATIRSEGPPRPGTARDSLYPWSKIEHGRNLPARSGCASDQDLFHLPSSARKLLPCFLAFLEPVAARSVMDNRLRILSSPARCRVPDATESSANSRFYRVIRDKLAPTPGVDSSRRAKSPKNGRLHRLRMQHL